MKDGKVHKSRPIGCVIFGICLIAASSAWSQIPSDPPEHWILVTPIAGLYFGKTDTSQNNIEDIRQEILDPALTHAIANAEGLSESDLATVVIKPAFSRMEFGELYQIRKPDKAFTIFSEKLNYYARSRQEGHTKQFVLDCLTNKMPNTAKLEPDLQVLRKEMPLLPVWLLKQIDSGTRTNKADVLKSRTANITIVDGKAQTNITSEIPKTNEITRWSRYYLVDGKIAWVYSAQFNVDGSVHLTTETKEDGKEYDPKYRKIIEEVNEEVKTEMMQQGTYRKFGSIHDYWLRKKEKLRTRGIEWRSPAELNPNMIID